MVSTRRAAKANNEEPQQLNHIGHGIVAAKYSFTSLSAGHRILAHGEDAPVRLPKRKRDDEEPANKPESKRNKTENARNGEVKSVKSVNRQTNVDYGKKTIAQLKVLLRKKGIVAGPKDRKNDLIARLEGKSDELKTTQIEQTPGYWVDYSKYTVGALKEILEQRRSSTVGKKADLVARLESNSVRSDEGQIMLPVTPPKQVRRPAEQWSPRPVLGNDLSSDDYPFGDSNPFGSSPGEYEHLLSSPEESSILAPSRIPRPVHVTSKRQYNGSARGIKILNRTFRAPGRLVYDDDFKHAVSKECLRLSHNTILLHGPGEKEQQGNQNSGALPPPEDQDTSTAAKISRSMTSISEKFIKDPRRQSLVVAQGSTILDSAYSIEAQNRVDGFLTSIRRLPLPIAVPHVSSGSGSAEVGLEAPIEEPLPTESGLDNPTKKPSSPGTSFGWSDVPLLTGTSFGWSDAGDVRASNAHMHDEDGESDGGPNDNFNDGQEFPSPGWPDESQQSLNPEQPDDGQQDSSPLRYEDSDTGVGDNFDERQQSRSPQYSPSPEQSPSPEHHGEDPDDGSGDNFDEDQQSSNLEQPAEGQQPSIPAQSDEDADMDSLDRDLTRFDSPDNDNPDETMEDQDNGETDERSYSPDSEEDATTSRIRTMEEVLKECAETTSSRLLAPVGPIAPKNRLTEANLRKQAPVQGKSADGSLFNSSSSASQKSQTDIDLQDRMPAEDESSMHSLFNKTIDFNPSPLAQQLQTDNGLSQQAPGPNDLSMDSLFNMEPNCSPSPSVPTTPEADNAEHNQACPAGPTWTTVNKSSPQPTTVDLPSTPIRSSAKHPEFMPLVRNSVDARSIFADRLQQSHDHACSTPSKSGTTIAPQQSSPTSIQLSKYINTIEHKKALSHPHSPRAPKMPKTPKIQHPRRISTTRTTIISTPPLSTHLSNNPPPTPTTDSFLHSNDALLTSFINPDSPVPYTQITEEEYRRIQRANSPSTAGGPTYDPAADVSPTVRAYHPASDNYEEYDPNEPTRGLEGLLRSDGKGGKGGKVL